MIDQTELYHFLKECEPTVEATQLYIKLNESKIDVTEMKEISGKLSDLSKLFADLIEVHGKADMEEIKDIDSQNLQKLLTIDQVADHFCVDPRTINNWVRNNKLKAIKIEGTLRFEPNDIIAFKS